jgi:hypothetical protein
MAETTLGKVFFAEAVKGYTLKVMIDSLSLAMPRTIFEVKKSGLYHRRSNEGEYILYDIDFPRENFRPYICIKELTFSVNIKHLQKMVRNVKKKDSVTLYINKNRMDRLYVVIRPAGASAGYNSRLEDLYVTISHNKEGELGEVGLPECYIDSQGKEHKVYGFPKVIDSSDFQKIKKMTTVGKIVEIQMQKNNYISFCCSNGELYGTRLQFGQIVENPENTESEEDIETDYVEIEEKETKKKMFDEEYEFAEEGEEIKGWYEAEFYMNIFNMLMKLPGLCSQMQFYAPKIKRYPLKIKMQAGGLGSISIYIKDRIQIAHEQTEKEKELEEEQQFLSRPNIYNTRK